VESGMYGILIIAVMAFGKEIER